MKRVFIAINLPKEIKKTLSDFQKEVKEYFSTARLIKTNNLHITLAFLGEISQTKIKSLIQEVEEATKELSPFSLTLTGVGTFPSSKAKVIWIGLKDGKILTLLNQVLYRKLTAGGFILDDRKFSPHTTIARFREKPDKNTILLFLKNFQKNSFGKIEVESIEVMESELTKEGPAYRVVEEIKLT